MADGFRNLRIGTLDPSGVFIPGQPVVQRVSSKEFIVVEPYIAKWDGGYIEVEPGFRHDLASIPRIFHVIIPKTGLHDGPSVIHDWCYVNLHKSRVWSDRLFLCCMKAAGSWWLRRNVMWLAVRVGGWVPWNRRAARRQPSK